jgi:hypothetical protein
MIKREHLREDIKTPGILVTDFLTDLNTVSTELFSNENSKQDIRAFFMDIAEMHEFN